MAEQGTYAPEEVLPFNPLQPKHLGESLSRALGEQPCHPLSKLATLVGAGVYAIYYQGNSTLYEPFARDNASECKSPIYVGKAVPRGSRKGVAVQSAGTVLYQRLREHAESIRQVQSYNDHAASGYLAVEDFSYRFLVVDDVWIPLIESLSITSLKPPWNGFVDGFGHHDQGSTRRSQQRSLWDSLHPGRPWALKFQANTWTTEQIADSLNKWWQDSSVRLTKSKRSVTAAQADEDAVSLS